MVHVDLASRNQGKIKFKALQLQLKIFGFTFVLLWPNSWKILVQEQKSHAELASQLLQTMKTSTSCVELNIKR